MNDKLALFTAVLLGSTACQVRGSAPAAPSAKAHYLANAGVLIVSGETKIAFDPIFRNDFGTYRLLPVELEQALFEGRAPFDGLDAVFISHYHEDHFSAVDVPRLLRERPEVRLYAPAQAVSGMSDIANIRSRITEIALEYKDAPLAIEAGNLLVEAIRIPHSGWPDRRLDVENIAFRVTLDGSATVLHLGDADTSEVHFERDAAYWDRRHTDMAFPPYWYFQSEDGRRVLENRLKPGHAVGIHVPVETKELSGFDLFVEPGETRDIVATRPAPSSPPRSR
jgi:L-ascorbate metabolism protein UlaG (beta-lactamase superfamily)